LRSFVDVNLEYFDFWKKDKNGRQQIFTDKLRKLEDLLKPSLSNKEIHQLMAQLIQLPDIGSSNTKKALVQQHYNEFQTFFKKSS